MAPRDPYRGERGAIAGLEAHLAARRRGVRPLPPGVGGLAARWGWARRAEARGDRGKGLLRRHAEQPGAGRRF
jgi:hypothetical protein